MSQRYTFIIPHILNIYRYRIVTLLLIIFNLCTEVNDDQKTNLFNLEIVSHALWGIRDCTAIIFYFDTLPRDFPYNIYGVDHIFLSIEKVKRFVLMVVSLVFYSSSYGWKS